MIIFELTLNLDIMKKYIVSIYWKDIQYVSDEKELNKEEYDELLVYIQKAVSGELDYLTFKKGKKEHTFGKNILKDSVITLIEK